jgi:hypothetical protein
MSTQQSQKTGKRSDAQKQDDARYGNEPRPASNPVEGAFGDHSNNRMSDQDRALGINEKTNKE